MIIFLVMTGPIRRFLIEVFLSYREICAPQYSSHETDVTLEKNGRWLGAWTGANGVVALTSCFFAPGLRLVVKIDSFTSIHD